MEIRKRCHCHWTETKSHLTLGLQSCKLWNMIMRLTRDLQFKVLGLMLLSFIATT